MHLRNDTDGNGGDEWADVTLSMDQLLDAIKPWFPLLTLVTFLPYLAIWGFPELLGSENIWTGVRNVIMGSVVALLIYAVSALLHEALHAAAMIVVGRVPASSLQFGMRLRDGVLYMHSSKPMTARAYRVVLLFPAVALGVVPAAVGTWIGNGWLVLYGYVMLVSAIGDLVVFRLMRDVDPSELVRDHPSAVGCQVQRTSD